MSERVFVFGSNLAGRHGAGAALFARKNHGAVYGVGIGRTGYSYAIPTKDWAIKTMPLNQISAHVKCFLEYAAQHPNITFDLTHIGCGLAGYNWERDIRPLFPEVMPDNIRIITPATPATE